LAALKTGGTITEQIDEILISKKKLPNFCVALPNHKNLLSGKKWWKK
jgi:hypothetical protein